MTGRRQPRKHLAPPAVRERPLRQRQRLIDACISALHVYGPSRTTVGKVVAFAKMSPGIVRFYFDSKAAMLIASLEYLTTEFERQVLVPVSALKTTPVAALQLMVDLFLDADFASPRYVSAWYTFWGEASSRQEYYDICGQKDEGFARLVHELVAALILETRQPHLDADGIALGLIGVFEILWQDIAFQTERDIDRPGAKRRCMAYLRSVFPSRFDPASAPSTILARFAPWVYADARLFAQERELLFSSAWAVVGHESQVPHLGDFLTVEIGSERVLLVRDASGRVRALRNNCPESPHTLQAARSGRFESAIDCRLHRARFSLAGQRLQGTGGGNLTRLELTSVQGLLFARSQRASPAAVDGPDACFDAAPAAGLTMVNPPQETAVAADWKLIVERWLEPMPFDSASLHGRSAVWYEQPAGPDGWSAARYRHLLDCLPAASWRRQFLVPNQLLELRPDGLSVIQVWPAAAGRCVVRRLDYSALAPDNGARAALYLAQRLAGYTRRSTIDFGPVDSIRHDRVRLRICCRPPCCACGGLVLAATRSRPPVAAAGSSAGHTMRISYIGTLRRPGLGEIS